MSSKIHLVFTAEVILQEHSVQKKILQEDEKTSEDETNIDYVIYKGCLGFQRVVAMLYENRMRGRAASEVVSMIDNPLILKFIGEIEDGVKDNAFFVYESYACSLGKLIKDFEANNQRVLVKCCINEECELNFRFLEHDRPSVHFQKLMRGIIQGVKVLHDVGKIHGNLNITNVAISITESREVIVKLINVADNIGLPFVDILGTATIARYCMGIRGVKCQELQHMYETILSSKGKVSSFVNAYSLDRCICVDPTVLLNLPFFWSPKKCFDFFCAVRELLRFQVYGTDSLVNSVNNLQINWSVDLPRVTRRKIDLQKTDYCYNTHQVSHLVRFIRKKGNHVSEWEKEEKKYWGTNPESLFMYFHRKHPEVLMHIYRCVDKKIEDFISIEGVRFMAKFNLLANLSYGRLTDQGWIS